MEEKDFLSNAWEQVQSHPNFKYFASGAVVVLLSAAVGGGMYYYNAVDKERAQDVFCESASSYEMTLRKFFMGGDPKKESEEWADIELELKSAYNQIPKSETGAYIKTLEAETLIRQQKVDEALVVLKEADKMLSSSNPIYYLCKTKIALISLDSKDEKVKNEGLELLDKLSKNKKNHNRDMALYYVGLYYWTKNDIEKAQSEWKILVDEFIFEGDDEKKTSPWAKMAKMKLDQVVK